MNRGFLIYNREDYCKNNWFAQSFISSAPLYNMNIELLLTDEITIGIKENKLFVNSGEKELKTPDFVINRSRESIIGSHFELMGCKVLNSSYVTEICNNKAKTHQIVNSKGINSVKTLLCNKRYFSANNINLNFPIILKSLSGHGGNEVYKINNSDELNKQISILNNDGFILQEMCSNPGIDIRVFVIGKEIVAAVKRYSSKSFKSNFSLGGEAEAYYLNPNELSIVNKIINLFDFDFAGIDFILDKNGNFLFNEIEDVVGCRTLYKNYNIDVVKKYLEHIKNQL